MSDELVKRLRDHINEGVTHSDRYALREEAADLLESQQSQIGALTAALERSLNWLSSYPGEGALGAYDQARRVLDANKQEGK